MSDWFSSVQVTEEQAAALRKSILEGRSSSSSMGYENDDDKLWEYEGSDSIRSPSRRSPVLFRNGGAASSQPLATTIGLELLLKGANAAEAAIGVSAGLAVTEPCSCGLGGDMFCLYYEASTKKVTAINGSGRSPEALTLEKLRADCPNGQDDFQFSAHAVTVPGAAKGWEDLLAKHGSGKFSLADLLEPAAKLAEEGFPVAPIAAHNWTQGIPQIKKWFETDEEANKSKKGGHGVDRIRKWLSDEEKKSDVFNFDKMKRWLSDEETKSKKKLAGLEKFKKWVHKEKRQSIDEVKQWLSSEELEGTKQIPLTVDGVNGPAPGDIMKNADLAYVLRELGAKGADEGFYRGQTGRAIVEAVQKHGGVLSMEDLEKCESDFPEPISVTYRDVRLWEVPPNGQGIAALIALKGLEALDEKHGNDVALGSTDYYHRMIEMMRLAFADNRAHVADVDCMTVTSEQLLDTDRLKTRAKDLFDPNRAAIQGCPDPSSCTVSFQVVDKEGNAISFVNSNYMGFGTGIVPDGCGFTLQNRGFGMKMDVPDDHPNVYGHSKRPYHTILPGMLTWAETDELYATFSNMGGNMQPQGHVQLTLGMVDKGLDPQAAIDFPRFCIKEGTQSGGVMVEKEVSPRVVRELVLKGHQIQNDVDGHNRAIFGRAQIIKKDPKTGVWWAGSDGRADGCAMGY